LAESALRILLVEDNPINQKVAFLMLKKLGYCADVVANGLEALNALEHHHYDVILMDIQMPEMDGLEATKKIRESWLNRGIIIIAITAHALEFTLDDCLMAGMFCYMTKPITTEDLRAALDMVRYKAIIPYSLQRQ
jgi:CheY-like chemotaxis protein